MEDVVQVHDHGYVECIESWGRGQVDLPEAGIIEAARQSTQGSFRGWEREQRLLKYLYENRHSTPFEFAGMVLEVQAPIFVFRQWHRHRIFSVNEASARYTPLAPVDFVPSVERVVQGSKKTKNKQAAGKQEIDAATAQYWLDRLVELQEELEEHYQLGLDRGVPKELARLSMTTARYSRMRVSTNVRGWLGFLALRLDPHAQEEIRNFAQAVAHVFRREFPQVWDLFTGNDGRGL